MAKITKKQAAKTATLEKGIAKVAAKNQAKRAAAVAKKPAAKKPAPKTAPVAVLTEIERKAIAGIIKSDFMDGATGDEMVGRHVWTWSGNPFPSPRTFSGAVSSLVKKGLAIVDGVGKEATVALTAAGLAAFGGAAPAAKPAKAKTAHQAAVAAGAKTADVAETKASSVTGAKATVINMIQTAKTGVSAAEIAKALGWPRAGGTISRAIALAPFKVRKERVDGTLRYFAEAK